MFCQHYFYVLCFISSVVTKLSVSSGRSLASCYRLFLRVRPIFTISFCIFLRRSTARLEGNPPPQQASAYRSQGIHSAPELMESLGMVIESLPLSVRWEPVVDFLKLGGVPLFLKLIALCSESNYSGRSETVGSRSAFDLNRFESDLFSRLVP